MLNGEQTPPAPTPTTFRPQSNPDDHDLGDVKGQRTARRALEVAAAGGHNLLLVGPPGTGKTLMARRLPSILPPPSFEEAIETTTIHSVLGLVPSHDGVVRTRPFRALHHSVSDVALLGGGSEPRPGEISLAHNGVLFLDEVPEFDRRALEVLRQPLEDGSVTVTRAAGSATFPARFMLVAAMNPCACGYAWSSLRACRCTPAQIERYRGKLSGPFQNRFDLTVPVAPIPARTLANSSRGESSIAVRKRVVAAREKQDCRYRGLPCQTNADLRNRRLSKFCQLAASERRLLERAVTRLGLSARAYYRVRRVALTIADLDGATGIDGDHLAEALAYRVWADT